MTILASRSIADVVRMEWTDDAGGTYNEYDAAGQLVASRSFSAAETAWLAEWQSGQALRANRTSLLSDLAAGIDLVKARRAQVQATAAQYASLSTNQATGATALKAAFAEAFDDLDFLMTAVIRLARVVADRTDDTST